MRRRAVAASVMLLTLCGLAAAQNAAERSKDEAAIRAIIATLSEAWTKADAKLWGDQFTEDADFTAWTGGYVKGRDAIARGHEEVFHVFYPGTKQRLTVRSLRFLRNDVAVVHVEGSVVEKDKEFPPTPQSVPVAVLTKERGRWRIAVFQNTMIQSRQSRKQ
jgi:uncharacterized protein (TIGR02246 family)